jgi:quercetin dioxygenase-like cupin family protein
MVSRHSDINFHTIGEGNQIRTLVLGKETLMVEFRLAKNASLLRHNHPYEQTGYLLSGSIILHIEEKKYEMKKGDSWCIHKNIFHQAEVLEDARVLEIFSPMREEYKKYLDTDSLIE